MSSASEKDRLFMTFFFLRGRLGVATYDGPGDNMCSSGVGEDVDSSSLKMGGPLSGDVVIPAGSRRPVTGSTCLKKKKLSTVDRKHT